MSRLFEDDVLKVFLDLKWFTCLFSRCSHTRPSYFTSWGESLTPECFFKYSPIPKAQHAAPRSRAQNGAQSSHTDAGQCTGHKATRNQEGCHRNDPLPRIRSGPQHNAEPQPVDSEAVKLIKRGPEYGLLTRDFSDVSDAIDEALVALEHGGYIHRCCCLAFATIGALSQCVL